jgi:hypothetical protein
VKFGQVPVEKAVGAVVAHSVRAGDAVVKKRTIISSEAATQLRQAGIDTIAAAQFEPRMRNERRGVPCSRGWAKHPVRNAMQRPGDQRVADGRDAGRSGIGNGA